MKMDIGEIATASLRWRHNDHYSVSNHQPHSCLLNRLFRRRWKNTSKLRVTGLCVGNSPGPVNSPHKGPVTRKMFPFDDVIMMVSDSEFNISVVHEFLRIYFLAPPQKYGYMISCIYYILMIESQEYIGSEMDTYNSYWLPHFCEFS